MYRDGDKASGNYSLWCSAMLAVPAEFWSFPFTFFAFRTHTPWHVGKEEVTTFSATPGLLESSEEVRHLRVRHFIYCGVVPSLH